MFPDLRQAAADYAAGHNKLLDAADIVGAIAATAEMIDAVKQLKDLAGDAYHKLRDVLASVQEETGATGISTGSVVVSYSRKPPTIVITDPSLVPDEYWYQPERKVDMKRLLKDRKKGPIPGVDLIDNGEPVTRIRGVSK